MHTVFVPMKELILNTMEESQISKGSKPDNVYVTVNLIHVSLPRVEDWVTITLDVALRSHRVGVYKVSRVCGPVSGDVIPWV